MDVPIIAAAWFEGDIGDGDGAIDKRRLIALADKILGKPFELFAGFKDLSKIVITQRSSLVAQRQ